MPLNLIIQPNESVAAGFDLCKWPTDACNFSLMQNSLLLERKPTLTASETRSTCG